MTLALTQPKIRTVKTIQQEKKNKEMLRSILKLSIIFFIAIFAGFTVFASAEASLYTNPDGTHVIYNLGGQAYDLFELNGNLAAYVFMMCYFFYAGIPGLIGSADFLQIDTTAGYFDVFRSISNIVAPVGIGFGVIWVLLDLIEKAQMDQMTPEVLIRMGIKLIAMVTIINNVDLIAENCINAGNALMEQVSSTNALAGPNSYLNQCYQTLRSAGVIKQISMMVEMIVPALTVIICFIVMLVQMYGRILECGIRLAFMPLGVADAFTHGINSPGIRYIKKFFAVCLQGAVLIAIMIAGIAIQTADSIDGGGALAIWLLGGNVLDLVITITMVGAMLKSQQLVNDVVGV